MRADLHVHSTASDGTLSPSAVVEEARARGLSAIALTDHDTTAGVPEAVAAGERLGVEVVPGVEINTDSPAGEVHVLGYYVSPDDEEFNRRLETQRRAREVRAHRMLERLRELGMPVEYERLRRLAGDAPVGRPHIARAMLEAGYVKSVKEAFDRWLYRGGPAYVRQEKLTPARAVELVRWAGGVPVLAHPGRIDDQSIIEELIAAGLEGLECYYPEHAPEQTERYLELARKHDLVVTGGTDYHGPRSTHDADLGSLPVPAGAVEELKERVRKVRGEG